MDCANNGDTMRLVVLISSLLTIVACGGKTSDSSMAGANPCGANPCGANPCGANPCGANPCGNPCGGASGGGAVNPDFADWASWTKKTPARLMSKSHSKMWVEIYTDGAASAPFDAKQGPYPEGARIVKAQYAAESGGDAKNLTVMKKMPAGYDPDNGDWYYGVLGADGSVMKEGKIEMCSMCHDQVSEQDYVFGQTE